MKMIIKNIFFASYIVTLFVFVHTEDSECAARQIPGQSVVCVCNETYCDTVTREPPGPGRFLTYTSSLSGLRFKKNSGCLKYQSYVSRKSSVILELDPNTMYQTVEGFGGAVTDAVGYHWHHMPEALQKYLIDSYFSEVGLQYNMIRVPIGGTDYSTHQYAYNELPVNDTKLTNYSLSYEDYHYKIPLIKSAIEVTSADIHIVATTWSPPPWMKTNNMYLGTGNAQLKPEYYQTYADYHCKFLEKYREEDITIWAITTTNEPTDAFDVRYNNLLNCMGWTPHKMGKWIIENLGPKIRNSIYKDVKILAIDDQRSTIPTWFKWLVLDFPQALDVIDGLAVHGYDDNVTSATVLTTAEKAFPGKFIISTEYSEDFPETSGGVSKVKIGSWDQAKDYFNHIITDLAYNLVGWIDWNLCLDERGGPSWSNNSVDSPVITFPERREFYKQPMFYATGHFSKFIPRGSRRIKISATNDCPTCNVTHVAFVTPYNSIVTVLYNNSPSTTSMVFMLCGKQAEVSMVPNSMTTVEFNYEAGCGDEVEGGDAVAVVDGCDIETLRT